MARDMIEMKVADTLSATRERWIAALRRQGHRQCHEVLTLRGNVCALGLLAEVAGLPLNYTLDFPELRAATGMSDAQLSEIILLNDGHRSRRKHTFAEIADIVEGWLK